MSLYLEHFNLRELPFRITPAVEFFYRGCVRGETLDALKYAIENGEGIMSVVGEVGTGKSMLCRVLMTDLADEVRLVYIANPSFSDLEIIFHIAEELGIEISDKQHQVARDLQSRLLELNQAGQRVLVCIDEAQAMPDSSLEQIRLLSNLETSTDKIVQIVMFGQPELTEKLGRNHMRQLRERITSSFNLRNLNADEVRDYIVHRLRKAGANEPEKLFSRSAIGTIAKVSQGISRRINILCDKAMLAAFAEDSDRVTNSHAQQAARDARYRRFDDDAGQKRHPGQGARAIFGGLAAVAAVAAVAYQMNSSPAPEAGPEPVAVQASEPAPAQTQGQGEVATASPARPAARPEPQPVAQQQQRQEPNQVALVDNPRWHSYPPSSYLRLRLNATETLFGQVAEPGLYTARILTVPRDRVIDIERYLRDLARFFTVRNVLVYPAVAEGQEVFVITYGSYPSEFQAELFIHELPSFFRSNKPFTQALAVSQLEAAQNW